MNKEKGTDICPGCGGKGRVMVHDPDICDKAEERVCSICDGKRTVIWPIEPPNIYARVSKRAGDVVEINLPILKKPVWTYYDENGDLSIRVWPTEGDAYMAWEKQVHPDRKYVDRSMVHITERFSSSVVSIGLIDGKHIGWSFLDETKNFPIPAFATNKLHYWETEAEAWVEANKYANITNYGDPRDCCPDGHPHQGCQVEDCLNDNIHYFCPESEKKISPVLPDNHPAKAYDPERCITAAELRKMGMELSPNIPDIAWVPRYAIQITSWNPRGTENIFQIAITSPFRWVQADIIVTAVPTIRKGLNWRCGTCGAWHKEMPTTEYNRLIAVTVPDTTEEGYCNEQCPFHCRESSKDYFCIIGLHQKPKAVMDEGWCRPGPECPAYEKGD